MNITIKFFAILKEIAGRDQITMRFEDGADITQVIVELRSQFPSLDKHLSRIAYAVNREYVQPNHLLKDDDELALIPPVSGG